MHVGSEAQHGAPQVGGPMTPEREQHTSPGRQLEPSPQPVQDSPSSRVRHSALGTQPTIGSKTLCTPQSHPGSQQSSIVGSPHVKCPQGPQGSAECQTPPVSPHSFSSVGAHSGSAEHPTPSTKLRAAPQSQPSSQQASMGGSPQW